MIKLSIIIPNFNNSNLIEQCVESIGSFENIEVIIIDDKSTDNSSVILKKIKDKFKDIKIIYNKENLGLGLTRNIGIKESTGDYIMFLDADDLFVENGICDIKKILKENELDLLHFRFKRMDYELTKKLNNPTSITHLNYHKKNIAMKYVLQGKLNFGSCFNVYSKKLITENNIYFSVGLHEDILFTINCFLYAKKIKYLNAIIYIWRENKNSITGNFTASNTRALIGVINELKKLLIVKNLYKKHKFDHFLFSLRYINYIIQKRSIKFSKLEYRLIKDTLINLGYLKYLKKNVIINQYPEVKIFNNKTLIPFKLRKLKALIFKKLKLKFLVEFAKRILKFFKNFNSKFDLLFLPQNKYHFETMLNLANLLNEKGFKVSFINPGYKLKKYNFLNKKFENINYEVFSTTYFYKNIIKTSAVLCMNDWDKQFTNQIVKFANKRNIKTIGLIEGINDFLDIDTGRDRSAYKTVKYLLLTGQHDKQFFNNTDQNYFTVGIPRLEKLKKQNINKVSDTVLINLNFTFNVLTEYSSSWISEVIQACEELNLQYKITKHPDDKTEVDENFITSEQIYDGINNSSVVISRFSTVIIEALALGKPVVYHNPGFEKVEKFKDSLGAYSISSNIDQLKKAIMFELEQKDIRVRANDFLQMHANINFDSLEKTKNAIITILNNDGK